MQRDILPIVEGTQINTQYGPINTELILFIGSGAFAEAQHSDLIAELTGRLLIRVELKDSTETDFVRILTEPEHALIKTYIALIGADGVQNSFTKEAVERIAEIATLVHHDTDNIGARRLDTILEKLLEDVLYEGPDMAMGSDSVTQQYVDEQIGHIAADRHMTRVIL